MGDDDYLKYLSQWKSRYGNNSSAIVQYKPQCWLAFGRLDYGDFCHQVKRLARVPDSELPRIKTILLLDN